MDLTTEALVAIALVIVVGIVVFFEWRFLRERREGRLQAAIEQDEAFNSITTARAIAQALRDQGRDVLAGETLIHQAEGAYERRSYKETINLADKAKTVLKSAKTTGDLQYCAPTKSAAEEEEECVPAIEATRKLPQNYLESKFIIETTADRIQKMNPDDVKEASDILATAQQMFDSENYTEALKCAMKSRRILDSEKKETIPAATTNPSPALIRDKCSECGADMDKEDAFCPQCGAGIARKCPGCSADVVADDKFCRKCGARVSS